MTTNDKILNGSGLSTVLGLLKNEIDGITSTIVTPVQSDWSQSITTSLDFIKNKPVLPQYNIVSYYGKNASPSSGDNYYHFLSTDIADGTTHIYNVPVYPENGIPQNKNQVTTKEYVDGQINSVTTLIESVSTVTDAITTSLTTYVAVVDVIPVAGLTGTVIAEIGGKSIYAPVAEGGIQVETDPVFTASAAYGITATDISNWDAKSDFSGSYNDLTDKPTIPTAVSELTNDSNFITSTALTPYLEKSGISVAQGLTTGVTVGAITIDSTTTTLYAPAASEGFHKVVLTESSGSYSITSSGDTFASIKQRLDNNQVVYVTISGSPTIYHINSIDSSELTFRNISNTEWKNISITSSAVTVTDISISNTENILEIK